MRIVTTPLLFWADGMTVTPRLVVVHPRGRRDVGAAGARGGALPADARGGDAAVLVAVLHLPGVPALGRGRGVPGLAAPPAVRLRHFARALARGYLLDIDEQEAERLIRG
jgi:hypothetical protein